MAGETNHLSTPAAAMLVVACGSVVFGVLAVGFIMIRAVINAVRGVIPSGGSTAKSKTAIKGNGARQAAQPAAKETTEAAAAAPAAAGKDRGPDLKTLIKESQKAQTKKGADKDDKASHHHLFLNTLKGHGDVVHSVAWSADGMQLATACEDMMVRVFDVQDVTNKDPKFKRVKTAKIPIGAGFAEAPDTVAALMRGIPDAILGLYGPSPAGHYDQVWSAANVHAKEPGLAMRSVPAAASYAKRSVIVSCSTKKDVRVYNPQGRELAVLEPNSLANHELAVSWDGRFVAVASFTAEVKIWELKFAKDTGDFKGASKAMELKGHKSQVLSVAISPDSKKAVTVSKDGTLRVWNIDVRYHLSEDPKTTLVIPMPLPGGKAYQHLAFGPGGIIAASHEGTVHLLDSVSGDLLDSIDAHDSTITCMQWCPRLVKPPGAPEPVAVLATSSRDKRARLWQAPARS